MSEDTINDMNSNNSSDSMALTDAQLVEYTAMNPFIIYLDGGERVKNKSVVAALLEGVRLATTDSPNSIKVRKQGVRKGELGYNAKATITDRKLVPVFALVEERLVDEMRVSPAALAMGMAAHNIEDTVNLLVEEYKESLPDSRDMVDCLVEEYVEAAPIEREFFLPEPDLEVGDVLTTDCDVNVASPTFTATMPNAISDADAQLQDQLVAAYTQDNYDGNYIPVSDNVMVSPSRHAELSLTNNEALSEPKWTRHDDAPEVVHLEPGVVADGELLDFNPEVHVIP